MPIRLTKDEKQHQDNVPGNEGGGVVRGNSSLPGDCKSKVMRALNGIALTGVPYNSDKGRTGFSAAGEHKNAVASIIEIDKN